MSYYKSEDPCVALREHAAKTRLDYLNSSPEDLLNEMLYESSEEGPEVSVDFVGCMESMAIEEIVKMYVDPEEAPPSTMLSYDDLAIRDELIQFLITRRENEKNCENVEKKSRIEVEAPESIDFFPSRKSEEMPEDYVTNVVSVRETHPFCTEVPLIGGPRGGPVGRRKGKNKKRKGKVRGTGNRRGKYEPVTIPGINEELTWTDNTVTRNPGNGTTYGAWAIKINDIYAPDPLGANGVVVGFAALSTLYNRFKVMRAMVDVQLTSLETSFPISCALIPSAQSFVADATTRQNVLALVSRYNPKVSVMSEKAGMDRSKKFRMAINLPRLLGDVAVYKGEEAYAGNYNASPATPLYLNILIWTNTAGDFGAGVSNTTTVRFFTRFYQPLATLLSLHKFGSLLEDRQMSVFSLLISIKRDRAEALAAIKAVWKLDELILSSFGSGDFYASERKRHDLFFL